MKFRIRKVGPDSVFYGTLFPWRLKCIECGYLINRQSQQGCIGQAQRHQCS